MSAGNRRNVYILAFTLLVVMLGFGLVIPIMPFYVEHLGAGGTELGLLVASYAVTRLIFGPLWGSLSDRVGRKPVLMVGILGYAVTMVWFGLATELWMLFVARSLSGILSSATSPTTMAYVSDSTGERERSRGMGILGAAIGVGTVLGPGLGGWLAGDAATAAQLALPFFVAGGMSGLALLLIGLLLPESLPVASRQRVQGEKVVRPGELWRALRSPIRGLLFMAFLVSLALTGFFGVFGLYALERYACGPQQVGLVLMVVGLVSAVVQGGLTGPLTERWGEAAVIKASLLVTALGFAAMALAGSTLALLLATGLFSFATALLSPAVTSLTSRHTTMPQGITMGLSNAFMSLGRIVGPLSAGFAFDLRPEYPYLGGAVVTLAGFLLSLGWVRQGTRQAASGEM
ncbi:MAG: MFS transporter [Anaerolineae bacterium]|nr:MFS transporter [Anaerolineae bacterium]